MSVLIVAAHPDDEVLGAGGAISKWAANDDVHILILGEGVSSRYADPAEASAEEFEELHAASRRAASILGVQEPVLARLPDNRFDSLPLLDVIKVVEDHVDALQPHTVVTHHGGDLNIDHQITHRAVMTATRPTPGHSVRNVYAFEVASSSEWSFGQVGPRFQPNVYVDISETLADKMAALAEYEGEMRPEPHARSLKAVEAMARFRGTQIGVAAAEAWQVMRSIQ